MLAGAFAGIAVRSIDGHLTKHELTATPGAHGDVSSGLDEGMISLSLSWSAEQAANRPFATDPDANHKPCRGRAIYGTLARSIYDISNRRLTDAMERGHQCHRWSRCVAVWNKRRRLGRDF